MFDNNGIIVPISVDLGYSTVRLNYIEIIIRSINQKSIAL